MQLRKRQRLALDLMKTFRQSVPQGVLPNFYLSDVKSLTYELGRPPFGLAEWLPLVYEVPPAFFGVKLGTGWG